MTEANAHPHSDTSGRVHIVLNGIVENHAELRAGLMAEGARFTSETDAEVVAHLIARTTTATSWWPSAAPTRAARPLLVRRPSRRPARRCSSGARKECPLVVGVGGEEHFVGLRRAAFRADAPRVESPTASRRRHAGGAEFAGPPGAAARAVESTGTTRHAEKGGFETFMLKEIPEQPAAIAKTVFDRLADGDGPQLGMSDASAALRACASSRAGRRTTRASSAAT